MLSKMYPDQVSDQWEAIRPGIESSLPYTISEHNMNKLLEEFMVGNMQCWVLNQDGETYAIITTMTNNDFMGRKILIIYSIYGYKQVQLSMWKNALTSLIRWAKAQGCDLITAQADNAVAARLAKAFNAVTTRSIILYDLHKEEES